MGERNRWMGDIICGHGFDESRRGLCGGYDVFFESVRRMGRISHYMATMTRPKEDEDCQVSLGRDNK